MNRLLFLNRLPGVLRYPAKWLIFVVALLAVCFPRPDRLMRHVDHWKDPNALIEPDAALLQPLVEELTPLLAADLPPKTALRTVERFVHEKLPYDWDWNTWGNADYLPTVTEALEMGREDCDGRAVVAASLLTRFGFHAQIVTDFAHVWVKTDKGETMGPGKRKAVVATEDGLKVQPGAIAELSKALAYSVAPFPLVRELILVLVAWWLLLRRDGGAGVALVGLLLMLDGLFFLRTAGVDYRNPMVGVQWFGVGNFLAAGAAMLIWGRHNAQKARREREAYEFSASTRGLV